MEIEVVTRRDYELQAKHYASAFDWPDFNEHNASKCEQLFYLLFSDSKRRLGLILGARSGRLHAPFSAPHAFFSWISTHPKTSDLHGAVGALAPWAAKNGFTGIDFNLPPEIYQPDLISKACNAFFIAGYKLARLELNHSYDLAGFGEHYLDVIDIKARQKLKASQTHGLKFIPCDEEKDKLLIYDIIKCNREHHQRPLRLSAQDILSTTTIIPADFFLIQDAGGRNVAAAICYTSAEKVAHIVFWGNLPDTNALHPMNFLSWSLLRFYSERAYHTIDIGISTEDSRPNYGLCDFKQSIGCRCSLKYFFSIDL